MLRKGGFPKSGSLRHNSGESSLDHQVHLMSCLPWAAWESNLVDQPCARYWQGHICHVSYPAVGTATVLHIPIVMCMPALQQSDMPKSCWGHQGGTFWLRWHGGPKEMHMQQHLLHHITSLVCSDMNRHSSSRFSFTHKVFQDSRIFWPTKSLD